MAVVTPAIVVILWSMVAMVIALLRVPAAVGIAFSWVAVARAFAPPWAVSRRGSRLREFRSDGRCPCSEVRGRGENLLTRIQSRSLGRSRHCWQLWPHPYSRRMKPSWEHA